VVNFIFIIIELMSKIKTGELDQYGKV